MPMTMEQIVEATSQWPHDQVADLVDRLTEKLHGGIDPEIEQAWKVETRRRVAEIQNGQAEFIPAEQVMAEARKIVGR
jgi:putative addiction module component (TIGR02574 family)